MHIIEKAEETSDLKKCPFCGSEDVHVYPFGIEGAFKYWFARCSSCKCKTSFEDSVEKAVSVWNRREGNALN